MKKVVIGLFESNCFHATVSELELESNNSLDLITEEGDMIQISKVDAMLGVEWVVTNGMDGGGQNTFEEIKRYPVRVFDAREWLSGKLHEAMGSASMCWNPTPAGEFDPNAAIGFSEKFMAELEKFFPAPEVKKDVTNEYAKCKKCEDRTILMSGYLDLTPDSEPYESGKEEDCDVELNDRRVTAHYCEKCDLVQDYFDE